MGNKNNAKDKSMNVMKKKETGGLIRGENLSYIEKERKMIQKRVKKSLSETRYVKLKEGKNGAEKTGQIFMQMSYLKLS